MMIMVVDGQGGGIGRALVEELHAACPQAELVAVGTNAVATANMMRAGAATGATGENAIVWNAGLADVIVGPVGIYFANSMAGEISPAMAQALACSKAEKIAIPVHRCHVHIAGLEEKPLKEYIAAAVRRIAAMEGPGTRR